MRQRQSILVLVILAGCAHEAAPPAVQVAAVPSRPTDRFVNVDGHKVHLRIWEPTTSALLPTIVFEAGAHNSSADWDLVAAELTHHVPARLVAWDRPGFGGSEEDGQPPTFEHAVALEHETLEVAGISPPWIIVGHSLGALHALGFASTYRDETAGLVLVEPPDFTSTHAQFMADTYAKVGLGEDDFAAMHNAFRTVATTFDPAYVPKLDVLLEAESGGWAWARAFPPPSAPTVVVIAGRVDPFPPEMKLPFPPERLLAAILAAHQQNLSRWAASLEEGTAVTTTRSGHMVPIDQPTVVSWAVTQVAYPDIGRRLHKAFTRGGASAVAEELARVHTLYSPESVSEDAINNIGVVYMFQTHELALAEAIFKDNAQRHPDAWNPADSLGEVYYLEGKRALALEAFRRSLALNPKNTNAQQRIAELSRGERGH